MQTVCNADLVSSARAYYCVQGEQRKEKSEEKKSERRRSKHQALCCKVVRVWLAGWPAGATCNFYCAACV
jgi:hypothetical protein